MVSLDRVLGYIDKINELAGKSVGTLIVPLGLITTLEVVLRYFFNSPTIWNYHISIFMWATMSTLGAGFALQSGSHITITLLTERVSDRKRAIMNLSTSALFFIFVGTVIWRGFPWAWKAFEMRQGIGIIANAPVWPFKMMLPVGASLLFLQGMALFIRNLRIVLKSSHKESP